MWHWLARLDGDCFDFTTMCVNAAFVLSLTYVNSLSFSHMRSYSSCCSSPQEMALLWSIFQLLIPPPSVCLHAPFALVYVHVRVCVCVSMAHICWLDAKSSSCRPLMGLKYPLLALTSVLSSRCHLSVSRPLSGSSSSDSFWRRNPP